MNTEYESIYKTKIVYIDKYQHKLKEIANQAINSRKYNLALSALSAACVIQNSVNQVYTDGEIEDLLLQLTGALVRNTDKAEIKQSTVIFYDGFGLDLRGWAASFAKALASLEYDIIFIEPLHAKGKIPHIEYEIEQGKGVIEYIDMKKDFTNHIKELNEVFLKYKPKTAFFYTTPYDVAGTVVFNAYAGKVNRIQVDLTDHAFWIGVNAIDYCTESRKLGVSNAIYHRGIPFDKILKMDGFPYVNRDEDPTPLPFDIEKENYVFSGGALYKTLGDEGLLYYKIVDYILANHNIKFLYAGNGDDTEIIKLSEKYPERVFHIHERQDFVRLIENSIFFLNTYPMFGGLMMRYAAMVGKIPLTLKHGSDHEGILFEQDKRNIEFDTFEKVIAEADRLLSDSDYRKEKEKGLKNAVISEEDYSRKLRMIIEESKSDEMFEKVELQDTSNFQAEYIERLKPKELVVETIANKRNYRLMLYFPLMFVEKIVKKINFKHRVEK